MKIQSKKSKLRKIVPILTASILLCAIGYGVYAKSAGSWPFAPKQSGDTAPALEDQSEESHGDKHATIEPTAEERIKDGGGSGQDKSSIAGSGVTDTEGKDVTTQSSGTSSASGAITLYSPTVNQKLKDGMTISGSSSTSEVYYRISDNLHGMVANNRLTVHNGHFSGKLSINTNATEGIFEVYSFNSKGQETNNISIKVRY